jgi:two-component system, chemotaxis family, chemotaxis protein CheY
MPRILLVESDDLARRSLADHVEKAGFEVATSANGKEAMAYLKRVKVDLLILDINMPEQDGVETIMALNAHKDRPKVIALTQDSATLDQNYVQSMAYILKAETLLSKPVSFEVLVNAIHNALENPRH